MKTAVLIPCFNEAKTIQKVIDDFKRTMPGADIYVYDNNSTDGTDEIARKAGAIVRYEYKQGKGNVVRSMFREIDADCYIMTDGDDTYPAESGPELEQEVLSGRADMAIGDRLSSTYFTENKRPFHNMGNVLVRKMINGLYQSRVKDIMTGLRGFSREFVKSFPVISKGFEIETEMTIFALDSGFSIVEIPIEYRDRPEGSESKLNTYSDGFRVMRTIFRLFRDTRPFAFFTSISMMIWIVCLCFFIPIAREFAITGMVKKFPTLIVISAAATVGVINFFCGVILTVLRKQHVQRFEQYLHILHYMTKNH
ncbi:MAG: glycosyltransferase family 2 protein [Eubacteriaceae bacterium]|nr:glycosyltransferase family 2 protein [Eubacteriaceae bacterium]MDD4507431.1 glycosyltransferase family 2 protein [Eubacteriaceae bacterium]